MITTAFDFIIPSDPSSSGYASVLGISEMCFIGQTNEIKPWKSAYFM